MTIKNTEYIVFGKISLTIICDKGDTIVREIIESLIQSSELYATNAMKQSGYSTIYSYYLTEEICDKGDTIVRDIHGLLSPQFSHIVKEPI